MEIPRWSYNGEKFAEVEVRKKLVRGTYSGLSDLFVPVFLDVVRVRCGRVAGAGFCSGGGACSCSGAVLPAVLVSLSGGGACSAVSGVLLL